MELYHLEALRAPDREALLRRPHALDAEGRETVQAIIGDVRERGDAALRDHTERFDGAALDEIRVDADDIADAFEALSKAQREAMDRAWANLERFHAPQRIQPYDVETAPGVQAGQRVVAHRRVGVYVPKGLVSSLLMAAVPARLAGVAELAVATPPDASGAVSEIIRAASDRLGIDDVYAVGGAQAIAALAHGTDTIPSVDKIVGPGNAYVTAAKALVRDEVGIDLLAGPSEVMLLVEPTEARPLETWAAWAADELRAQLEHGPGTSALLLTPSVDLAQRVTARFDEAELADRHTAAVIYRDPARGLDFVNAYGPEHLAIWSEQAEAWLDGVDSAGSVFLGPWAPVALGDFASGTNHVLPTARGARHMSGLSVRDFQKTISYQRVSSEGLRGLQDTVTTLARSEGLEAHARSVEARLKEDGHAPNA